MNQDLMGLVDAAVERGITASPQSLGVVQSKVDEALSAAHCASDWIRNFKRQGEAARQFTLTQRGLVVVRAKESDYWGWTYLRVKGLCDDPRDMFLNEFERPAIYQGPTVKPSREYFIRPGSSTYMLAAEHITDPDVGIHPDTPWVDF